MDDLIAFLNARLDEDEAAAKAWLPFGNPTAEQCEHFARHDPARVLRDVGAKRRIVAWHESECTCTWCDEEGDDLPGPDVTGYGCPTLLMIAAIWSDHPDYRQEWTL
jgi:hypothetical protein